MGENIQTEFRRRQREVGHVDIGKRGKTFEVQIAEIIAGKGRNVFE